jgi:hypothetical protein
MKKSLKLTIFVLLMIALHAVPTFADDFDIKFGLMKKDAAGKYYVYSETTTIPLTDKNTDPDFRFGYSIKTASDQPFTTYMIMHTPSAFEKYTGEFKDADKKEGGKTIQSPAKKAVTEFTYSLRFDRGDPLGQYKMEIWINGKPARTIDFTVTEAK